MGPDTAAFIILTLLIILTLGPVILLVLVGRIMEGILRRLEKGE